MCLSASSAFDWVEQYAPGFKKSVVGRDILAPPDLERIFGLTGGVCTAHCAHFRTKPQYLNVDTNPVCLAQSTVQRTRKSFASPAVFNICSDTGWLYKQLMVTDSFTTTHESESKFTAAV